jgi:putative toxin-antitoxin system antitoxin component (TIGR02293 family)
MRVKLNEDRRIIKKKLKPYIGISNFNIFTYARKGVKPELFYDLALLMNASEKDLADIIHLSPRTIGNYKDSKKMLDPAQSEHLLKLVVLYEKGEELFGNINEFNYWLQKPFWGTREKPIDWLITPGGVDLVIDELTKLTYGDAV